jgi:CBS domain-containing protein
LISINAHQPPPFHHCAFQQPTPEGQAMKAQDVMTSNVVTARPNMTVQDLAKLMAARHISGLPVTTKDGEVVGMISESDFLHRVEIGTGKNEDDGGGATPEERARQYAKSHGRLVSEVMSRPVIAVQPDCPLGDVADTLDRNEIKRVPVLDKGKVVGIIARSDLVRALGRMQERKGDLHLGSSIIHQTMTEAMRALPWLDTSYVNSTVKDGVVKLSGYVQSDDHRKALRALVEGIAGVARVEDNLTVGMPTLNWDGTISRAGT